ncbi:MAG TPA: hypothetical protein VII39_14090 [Bradyrhizobium sp.]
MPNLKRIFAMIDKDDRMLLANIELERRLGGSRAQVAPEVE